MSDMVDTAMANAERAGKPKRQKRKGAEPSKTPEQRQAERRERFKRLAPVRVTKVLKCLEGVGRMGNRAVYSYTDEEFLKIRGALSDALEAAMDCYAPSTKQTTQFTL